MKVFSRSWQVINPGEAYSEVMHRRDLRDIFHKETLLEQSIVYRMVIIKSKHPSPVLISAHPPLPFAALNSRGSHVIQTGPPPHGGTTALHQQPQSHPPRTQNVNFMSAGFSTTGTQNDGPTSMPSGTMDVKVWMRHSRGKKWCAQTMSAVQPMQKTKVPAKPCRILDTSSRKLTCSASLAVAPH